jgi:adenosylhomocysteine nucleosidase
MGAFRLPRADSPRNHSLSAAGVVAALSAEARTLGTLVKRDDGLWNSRDGTLIAVSGVGGAAAALAARALLDAGAHALVSWGMAGGLDPRLAAGTVCLPSVVMSQDGASFSTDTHWRELLRAAIGARQPVVQGKLLTCPEALADAQGKAAAFHDTGALVVDMESTAVAEVAASRGIPFIAVRVVVDTATDSLPPSVVRASSAGQVNLARLIRGLIASPREIPALLRLAARYRAARLALHTVALTGSLAPLKFAASKIRIA